VRPGEQTRVQVFQRKEQFYGSLASDQIRMSAKVNAVTKVRVRRRCIPSPNHFVDLSCAGSASGQSISTAAVAVGIVVGGIVLVVICLAAALLLIRRRKKRRRYDDA